MFLAVFVQLLMQIQAKNGHQGRLLQSWVICQKMQTHFIRMLTSRAAIPHAKNVDYQNKIIQETI